MPFSCDGSRFQRVIVFDLDDTLYLERDYVLSGLGAVGQWARHALGIDGLGDMMRCRFEAGVRTNIFDESLEEVGLTPSPPLIARMLTAYRQHRPDIRLAPDADQFLAARDPKTGFAVITDGFLDAQRRKIRALGLYARGIHLGICTDIWGRECWKPNPRAFEHVEQLFGQSGAALTYVADNPRKDFTAPRSRGWQTVQIARPDRIHQFAAHEGVKADRVIETLAEL